MFVGVIFWILRLNRPYCGFVFCISEVLEANPSLNTDLFDPGLQNAQVFCG